MFEIRDGVPHVMDRPVAWAIDVYDNGDGIPRPDDWPYERWWRMRGRGFHVLMENGLKLSTQWGEGNYCVNREPLMVSGLPDAPFREACPDAELACWWMPRREDDRMEEWPDGDLVCGWFPAEHWWALVAELGKVPTGRPIRPTVAQFLREIESLR